MSDPVFALVLLAAFFPAVALARYFVSLDNDFFRAAGTPFACGIGSGLVLAIADRFDGAHAVISGLVVTAAAIYVRHIGDESEPADGMLMGAVIGGAAAIPVIVWRGGGPVTASDLLLAGTVAGWGITTAVLHVRDRGRQLLIDAATALAAIGAALLPSFAVRVGAPPRDVAMAAAVLVPLSAVTTVFIRSGEVRRELAEEAGHGFIAEDDVARTAHPLRRFGRGTWFDAQAHREFVRIANRIALRKRQQRNRPDAEARLYQLEIIKLRMQLQEMARIGREESGSDMPSDRMHA